MRSVIEIVGADCADDSRVPDNPSESGEVRFADIRPEPHLYASQNPVCAAIVDRVAVLSKGGWDAVSKTPTASSLVICFRVELHHEP